MPLEGITRLQVLELPLRIHVAGSGDKPVQKPSLGMAYLRQGITWIPDYTMKVLDDETAELTLRGTLVNEAEDLIHSDVHLVVGVPHFVHTGYLAPLAVGQVIRSIGAAVGNLGVPPGVQSQIMNSAAIVRKTSTTATWSRSSISRARRAAGRRGRRRPGRGRGQSAPTRRCGGHRLHGLHEERPHAPPRREGDPHPFRQEDQVHAYLPLVAAGRHGALARAARTRRLRPGPPAPAWP